MENGVILLYLNEDEKKYTLCFKGIVTAKVFFASNKNGRTLSDDYSDNVVSWGQVQHHLSKLTSYNITIDMTDVFWFDVMGLMYLVHQIILTAKHNHICFLRMEAGVNLEKARFHAFLNEMGFLNCVAKVLSLSVDTLCDLGQVEKYKSVIQNSTYGICPTLLPLTIINSHEQISNVLNVIKKTLLQQSGFYVKSNIERTMSMISPAIQESVENVFEHAYGETDGECCIYLRTLKYGSIIDSYIKKNNQSPRSKLQTSNLISVDGDNLRKDINLSHYISNVLLAKETYSDSDEWIEHRDIIQVFVTDLGIGISNSFGEQQAGNDRNVIDSIFSEGKRSKNKIRNTKVGGLSMLKHLLEKNCNFISVKGDYNWVRYFGGDIKQNCNYITPRGKAEKCPSKGTALVFEIRVPDSSSEKIYKGIGDAIPLQVYGSFYNDAYRKMLTASYKGSDVKCCDFRYPNTDNSCSKTIQGESIYLVKDNTRKNEILSVIYEIDKLGARTLIIGDVNENEWKKYHFILNSITNITNIKKVIVITDLFHCGVSIKRPSTNGFYFDIYKTYEYVNMEGYSAPLGKYLFSYIMWLKWHDSRVLWNIIYEKNSYISGNILWSNGITLSEYLDFYRLSIDPLAKDIIKKQLARLRVFYKSIYYDSADRLMDELCAEMNRQLPNSTHKNNSISVGSVFVTGSSIENANPLKTIYVFKNAFAKDEVLALCDWCNEYDFELDKKNETYLRVGRTPFVYPIGDDYFRELHYKGHDKVYCARPNDVYDLIQTYVLQYGAMSRMGHVNMGDRHDMLHIDLVDIYNGERNWHYSVLDDAKENLWDYLVSEITLAIANKLTKNVFNVESDALKSIFETKVKQYAQKKDQNFLGGVVIYSTDYQTKEIIESLKSIYSLDYQKRIIPISPIVRNRTSASLLTSPMYLESLRKFVKEIGGSREVTLFFAESISTRQHREIEHIMYSLDAARVRLLSLVDRTRLAFGVDHENKMRAFCRIDLPSARNNNACLICRGRSVINENAKKLKLDLLSSCARKIVSNFDPFSSNEWNPGSSIYAREIMIPDRIKEKIEDICIVYGHKNNQITGLNVTTDLGLILFSVESTVISMSSDFLLECISIDDLNYNTKIMLLCAQLYHFSKQELTKDVYDQCIIALWNLCLEKGEQQENDNYLALGILVLAGLLNSNESLFGKLIDEVIQNNKTDNRNGLYMYLFMIIIYNTVDHELTSHELAGRLNDGKDTVLNAIYGIVLHTQNEGGVLHSKISYRVSKGAAMASRKMEALLLEIQYLMREYKSIPESYFFAKSEKVDFIMQILQSEESEIIQRMQLLNKSKEVGVRSFDTESEADKELARFNQFIIKKSTEMIELATEINEECFIKVVENWSAFRQSLQEIANQVVTESLTWPTKIKKICVAVYPPSATNKNRLFYYNRDIETEISYLMMDFRHASEATMEDSSSGITNEKCNGLVEVRYEDDSVEIKFKNVIDNSRTIDYIRVLKHNKIYRPSHLIFEQLNQKLPGNSSNPYYDIESCNGKKIFVATVKLPYVDL